MCCFFEFVKIIDDFSYGNCTNATLVQNKSIDDFIQNGKLDKPLGQFFTLFGSIDST